MIDLLKTRRSIRKFQNRDVEKDKLDQLLKAALLAPSSRARRPWEFIAVTDNEVITKLSMAKENGSQFLKDSPAGIVVIADRDLCDVWIEDSSIAAVIIQLTAHSIGLGSCWIQIRERMHDADSKAEEYIRGVLNIPERFSVLCMIAVGYPAEKKDSYDEDKLLYNKIHLNKF